MVTATRTEGNNELSSFSFKGLSTDTKPTVSWNNTRINNGSTFFEMDNQVMYFYDGATNTWLNQP